LAGLSIEERNDQLVLATTARYAAAWFVPHVPADRRAESGWNYPKEEFHSIQPYRLVGVDPRGARHTEREAERK